jgi:hypothetical protein
METPFPEIGNPKFITEFHLERLTLVEMQNKVIEEQQLTIGKRIKPVTITEVLNAITNMKSGKARDENGIGAEHYKYAAEQIAPFICECINIIFNNLDSPSSLKKRTSYTSVKERQRSHYTRKLSWNYSYQEIL